MGHASRLCRAAALALLLAGAGSAGVVKAQEPWLLSLEADATVPVLSAAERFEPGAAASIGVHAALADWFLLGARFRAGMLSDGPAPADATLADPGVGDLFGLGLSLRLRPLASVMPGVERGTGLFVELGGGGVLTGGLIRPSAEAALGWGFAAGEVDLAPVARWSTTFEVDNQLDERPTHVLMLGLELTLFDARPAEPSLGPSAPGDRDGDGLRDDVDHCTEEPEDFDGFQDADGCPEADNDGDGLLDAGDRCPLEPEDFDGFMDEDGCPDSDNDADRIRDELDACPDEPEVVNGIDDRDGCPDEGLITMVDDRIVLEERVLFDFERARVKSRARPVLRAIVALYRQHPEWVSLRVEGHADVRGTRGFNQRLSERRAARVRSFLVGEGIPDEIIDAIGYGETRPRAWGDTEEIHQANRRVEFVVLARRELTPEELAAEEAAARREREAARARRGDAAGQLERGVEPAAPHSRDDEQARRRPARRSIDPQGGSR